MNKIGLFKSSLGCGGKSISLGLNVYCYERYYIKIIKLIIAIINVHPQNI